MHKLLLLLLAGCSTASYTCPPLVEYTQTEQEQLAATLEKVNNPILDKFILDYGNLREKIRICNK